jgi:hypothetical protein
MSFSAEQSSKVTEPSQQGNPNTELDNRSAAPNQAASTPILPRQGESGPAPTATTTPLALHQPPARPLDYPPKNPGNEPELMKSISNSQDQENDIVRQQQPIPPPSEPMQYRAIGLVRGRYIPSEEQFNRGTLLTSDETQLDAVLLGQVMSLVKKHLHLEQEYLWVVYPRTRENQRSLHVQVLGVWEPGELNKPQFSIDAAEDADKDTLDGNLPAPLTDGYFSIRGEVIFQSQEKGFLVVKIQQSPRKSSDNPKSFKLRLEGTLPLKAAGYFWELEVRREANALVLEQGRSIALVPPKKVKKSSKERPQVNQKKNAPRPVRSQETKFVSPNQEARREPVSKPVKRNIRRPDA